MMRPLLLALALASAGALIPFSARAGDDPASLAKLLAGDSPDKRAKAADDLADLGPKAKSAVPALIKALSDDDPQVRGHAAYALGQIGDKRATVVNGLFALAGDREAIVRRAAIRALKALHLSHDVLIPKMATALKNADPADASAIVATLAEGGKEAVPFLIEGLDHKQACYWACLALGEIGPDEKPAVAQLARLESREEPEVRLQALVALGQIGPAAKPAVPQVAKALAGDKAAGVRYA
ncbi:MAG: HEAT repeat domain-containing protein, partial [Pirellulales bacterium]